MIEIRGITKRFGNLEVLRGIDFCFHPNKVNMIIGASGCGKSVLVKCMVGLYRPDSGEVLYEGKSFWRSSENQKREIRKAVGMLFQSGAIFDSMTVAENVAFPMRIFTQASEGEIRDRVAYCLERVGLAGTQKKYPSELSGGMKRRVGIARAIVLNPKYLICDEPNSGLDPQTSRKIDELIQEITYESQTITLVVTHDMQSVITIGDNIMFLYEGRKYWEGNRTQIRQAKEYPAFYDFVAASGLLAAHSLFA
ncbi:MAG: ABC transporter ATP-binding protein [Bacteroidia bacterium]